MNKTALLALGLLATLTAPAWDADAATLKPFSTLHGPVVRLSDIWDGVTADKALGPGPAPGGRITVPAPQLAAIARDYGVDWKPSSSGERTVLEWPGRALTREDVKPTLWTALTNAGAGAEAELEIGAFTAPLVPNDAKLDIAVQQLDVDAATGRFSAALECAGDSVPNVQFRVTGRIRQMQDVPVLRRRLLPGDVVAAADLEWSRIAVGLTRGDIIHAPADAIGLAAKHAISPGQPIQTADLGRVQVVRRGDAMALALDQPGLSLMARGVATENGGVGDHILVLNDLSRMTVEAEIIGAGQARVIPGTARPANRSIAAR